MAVRHKTTKAAGQRLYAGADWNEQHTIDAGAGAVLFAGALNSIISDGANLFWDNANKRLGIGTANPITALHVYRPAVTATYVRTQQGSTYWDAGQDAGSNIYRLKFGSVERFRFWNTGNFEVMIGGVIAHGDSYFDGDVGIGTATPRSTLHNEGGLTMKRTAVTLDYTALITDYIIGYTALAAVRTVTLPNALATAGRIFVIKDEVGNAGTNNIIIDPEGGTFIDGVLTRSIITDYGSMTVYSDGTNWFII